MAGEQEYAEAAVEYTKARNAFMRARGRLVAAVEKVGHDREGLLNRERLEGIIPLEDVRQIAAHMGPLRHKVPLPATFGQIKEYMSWSTPQANEWCRRQIKAGYVAHRGPRRAYIYYYTEKYHRRVGDYAAALRERTYDGAGGNSSVDELPHS